MRVVPLLLLAAAAMAEDRFPVVLKAFERAREKPFEPGARARVNPAVEAMIALKDLRALDPLTRFIIQTITGEKDLFAEMRAVQQRGATARKRVGEIDVQLQHLDVRLRAGAHQVAPQIEALKRERVAMNRVFDEVRSAVLEQERGVGYARRLRDTLADGCVEVLNALDSQQLPAGLTVLRRAFDIAKEREALLLVRILRKCAREGTAKHLTDIVTSPAVSAGSRRQAASALAALRDPDGVEALIQLWERDPKGAGIHVRHYLSLAAKRQLADAAAAREWAKTLK